LISGNPALSPEIVLLIGQDQWILCLKPKINAGECQKLAVLGYTTYATNGYDIQATFDSFVLAVTLFVSWLLQLLVRTWNCAPTKPEINYEPKLLK
jgi:hypothetical protein